jgi:hypothetical protein
MSQHTGHHPVDAELLGQRNHTELLKLRYHWSEAYEITVGYPHAWRAERRDNRAPLTADSAAVLRELIVADYTRKPVPRRPETCDD